MRTTVPRFHCVAETLHRTRSPTAKRRLGGGGDGAVIGGGGALGDGAVIGGGGALGDGGALGGSAISIEQDARVGYSQGACVKDLVEASFVDLPFAPVPGRSPCCSLGALWAPTQLAPAEPPITLSVV